MFQEFWHVLCSYKGKEMTKKHHLPYAPGGNRLSVTPT
jgi:hypothetical protein